MGSEKLGIGRYMTQQGHYYCTFVVARYDPAGNYAGRYKANVMKGTYDYIETCKTVNQIVDLPAKKDKIIGPTTKRTKGLIVNSLYDSLI